MNTITLTLCASTRTGCLSAPIPSCADERLTLAGDLTLTAGTSVALLTPRGNTLAHTILSEECAPGATIPLSTLTAQAAEYTRSCRAGDTREALLAVGDSEHPLALIPARIAQNPLYTLAPPTDLAPAYPTTETLQALLAEMQAASNAAAQSATAARKSAEEAGESASSAASDRATAVYSATSAQAYAEVATAAQARSSTSASEASTSAANAASSADSARDAASSAISAANSAAGSAAKAAASADSAAFALTASTNAANRAEVAAEKAREADISAENSATAASQSAAAAAQEAAEGVTALLQGKVDAAEAAKAGAETAKTAAETAKAGADAAKAAAASSATAAANSASQAKGYAESGSDALNERILRENVGISVAEYRVEVGDSPTEVSLVSAPKGAIVVTNIPYGAYSYIYWLHDGTATKTTFARSALAMSGMFLLKWWEGDAVYMVYKGTDGATKKATITFVNDEPNALEVQTLSDIDVATIAGARYCYVEGDFIVTSKGQVFNKNTLALIGSFTVPLYERFSPKNTQGYFLFITKPSSWRYRASRVKVQEDGSPLFETYSDLAETSYPTPLMVGMMNVLCMGFIGNNHVWKDDWFSENYANGLYIVNNTGASPTPELSAECLAEIYIPKNLYIGGLSLTYISSKVNFPIIRQVWRSTLGETGITYGARYYNTTSVTTRTGDGKFYFTYAMFNSRPCLFVQELTEVQ